MKTLEIPLINSEFNLILTWSNRCFIIDNPFVDQEPTITITDTKIYVPVVTLSTQDNANLLLWWKSGFKRTINWNKYEPKVKVEQWYRYLDFLINPSFQGVNIIFVLSFENNGGRINYAGYYLPLVEVKKFNIVIDGRRCFNEPVKNKLITYDNIRKIEAGQEDDYTTDCLLDYNYYKMKAIDLTKQQALDAGPKAIKQINFTANLDRDGNRTMFLLLKK